MNDRGMDLDALPKVLPGLKDGWFVAGARPSTKPANEDPELALYRTMAQLGAVNQQEYSLRGDVRLATGQEVDLPAGLWEAYLGIAAIDPELTKQVADVLGRPAMVTPEDPEAYCHSFGVYNARWLQAHGGQDTETVLRWIMAQHGRVCSENMTGVFTMKVGDEMKKVFVACAEAKGTGQTSETPTVDQELPDFLTTRHDAIVWPHELKETMEGAVIAHTAGLYTDIYLRPVAVKNINDPGQINYVIVRAPTWGVRLSGLCPDIKFHLLNNQVRRALATGITPHTITRRAQHTVENYLKYAKEADEKTEAGIYFGIYNEMNGVMDMASYSKAFVEMVARQTARKVDYGCISTQCHEANWTVSGAMTDFDELMDVSTPEGRERLNKYVEERHDFDSLKVSQPAVYRQLKESDRIVEYLTFDDIIGTWKICVSVCGILNQHIPTFDEFFSQIQKNIRTRVEYQEGTVDEVAGKLGLKFLPGSKMQETYDFWREYQGRLVGDDESPLGGLLTPGKEDYRSQGMDIIDMEKDYYRPLEIQRAKEAMESLATSNFVILKGESREVGSVASLITNHYNEFIKNTIFVRINSPAIPGTPADYAAGFEELVSMMINQTWNQLNLGELPDLSTIVNEKEKLTMLLQTIKERAGGRPVICRMSFLGMNHEAQEYFADLLQNQWTAFGGESRFQPAEFRWLIEGGDRRLEEYFISKQARVRMREISQVHSLDVTPDRAEPSSAKDSGKPGIVAAFFKKVRSG